MPPRIGCGITPNSAKNVFPFEVFFLSRRRGDLFFISLRRAPRAAPTPSSTGTHDERPNDTNSVPALVSTTLMMSTECTVRDSPGSDCCFSFRRGFTRCLM